MPRSDASILRQRQVRMYRAASRPIIRLYLFMLGLIMSVAGGTVVVSYLIALVRTGRTVLYGTSFQLLMECTIAYSWLVTGSLAVAFVGIVILILCFTTPRFEAHLFGLTARRPSPRFARQRHLIRLWWRRLEIAAWLILGAYGVVVVSRLLPMYPAVPLLVYAASLLIGVGLLFRHGVERRCSRCSYRLTSWRASANLCPECANPWKRLGGTVYGTRLHRAWLLSGIPLLLAAAAIWAFVPL